MFELIFIWIIYVELKDFFSSNLFPSTKRIRIDYQINRLVEYKKQNTYRLSNEDIKKIDSQITDLMKKR